MKVYGQCLISSGTSGEHLNVDKNGTVGFQEVGRAVIINWNTVIECVKTGYQTNPDGCRYTQFSHSGPTFMSQDRRSFLL